MLLGNSVFINVQFLKSLRTTNPQRARIHFPQSVNAVAFLPDFSLYQTPPTSVCLGALQIPNSNWWKAARLPDQASGQAPRRVWHKAYGGAGEREGRLRSPPGGRPASPEPAPRRERDPRRPPTPLRAARSEPGRAADGEPGRPRWLHGDGSTAPTRALRGASEVWTRKYMGRPAAARAWEQADGQRAEGCGAPSRTATRRGTCHSRRAGPRRPPRARASAPGSARRCSRAGPAPARTPPPTAPRAAHLHGLMVAPPGGLSLPEGARPQGTRNPGAGGPGGVGPSSSARALRPAAARTHLPAAAPRRVIGCPRPARQIEPSIHSWAGRARAAVTGLCPARAPPRSRARPPSTAAALPGASPGPVSAHGPHGPAVLREALSVGLRPFLLASVARPVGSTEYERWRQPALVSSAPRSVRWTTGWVSHRRAAGAAARDAWNSPH